MSDAIDAPASRPAFRYIVLSPFLSYAKGDVIENAAAIAVVEARFLPHVVRVRAGADVQR